MHAQVSIIWNKQAKKMTDEAFTANTTAKKKIMKTKQSKSMEKAQREKVFFTILLLLHLSFGEVVCVCRYGWDSMRSIPSFSSFHDMSANSQLPFATCKTVLQHFDHTSGTYLTMTKKEISFSSDQKWDMRTRERMRPSNTS